MKSILTSIIILSFVFICKGQKQQANFNISGDAKVGDKFDLNSDTLIASRFISDSLNRTYEIEYKYVANYEDSPNDSVNYSSHLWNNNVTLHAHYIALVNIIKYNGNKQVIIATNIKSIYSPTECSADNTTLWKQNIYEILNKKK